jgi:hypothetical protein
MQLNPPIFINVEYSQSFVQEYPICSRHKNVVAPYPTVDPDFYSGKLFMPGFPDIKRDKLIFYLGGMLTCHHRIAVLRSHFYHHVPQVTMAPVYLSERP